jgi:tryptophan synthase alpha chain
MSSISNKFIELRRSGRKGFIPFVTAGDPDIDTFLSIISVLAEEGADIIELGVPFSDPMADGPTIQASSQRALANGTTPDDVFDMVRSLRRRSDIPIVLFSYLNPLLSMGLDRVRKKAVDAGADGILITDVVDDDAFDIRDMLAEMDIDLISLAAPTTSDERLRRICDRARGFVYAISRSGITGTQTDLSVEAEKLVARIRRHTDIPVAVGFGISSRQQVEAVWQFADAAVVGSAIVAEIGRADGPADAPERVRAFVRHLVPKFAKTPIRI